MFAKLYLVVAAFTTLLSIINSNFDDNVNVKIPNQCFVLLFLVLAELGKENCETSRK